MAKKIVAPVLAPPTRVTSPSELELETLRTQNEELKAKLGQPVRRRLPDQRQAVTHKFNVAGHEGYMIVGMFDDGKPGELFITMAKEGSTIGGLMDTIGAMTSIALQHGVTVETLIRKFTYQRFEPAGYTGNPDIPEVSSIIDYVFRWLELYFVKKQIPQPISRNSVLLVESSQVSAA